MKGQFILGAVVLVFTWVAGYPLHKGKRLDAYRTHLPRILGYVCGGPGHDGRYHIMGVYFQLSGAILALLLVLAGLHLPGTSQVSLILLSGLTPLTIWAMWACWYQQRASARQDAANLSVTRRHPEPSSAILTSLGTPMPNWHPHRNWKVVIGILVAGAVWLLMCLSVVWRRATLFLQLFESARRGEGMLNLPEALWACGVFLAGTIAGSFVVLRLLIVRIDAEGAGAIVSCGYRYIRWSEVTKLHTALRDVLDVVAGRNKIRLVLSSFQSPEEVISEIAKRVPTGTPFI